MPRIQRSSPDFKPSYSPPWSPPSAGEAAVVSGNPYVPIPTGGRLHLKLGYVYGGSMDPASDAYLLTVGGIVAADLGTQVTVIGAGQALTYPNWVPFFPHDENGQP